MRLGKWLRVSTQSSGSPTGARYSFRDETLPGAGGIHNHLLDVVRLDGSTQMVGPIQVRIKPGIIQEMDRLEQARVKVLGRLSRRFWFRMEHG